MRALLSLIATAGAAVLLAGCGGGTELAGQPPATTAATAEVSAPPLPQGSETVEFDAADFVARIDNQYWPMNPGDRWIYRESDVEGAEQRVTVTVTDETKDILGIQATVVHDVVTEDGEVIEDTFDWYAQDRWGNVWYLGEDTKEFENGKIVSTEGSWEAGGDGAQAGVPHPGRPRGRSGLPAGIPGGRRRRRRQDPEPRRAGLRAVRILHRRAHGEELVEYR